MSTQLDTPFDTDAEEGSKFDLLPIGKYTAEVYLASVRPTNNGRGTIVKLTWQVTEGEHTGRLTFQNL
jgi:hypothetical protein